MAHVPHPKLPLELDAASAPPLTLAAVVIAALLLACAAALAGALPA